MYKTLLLGVSHNPIAFISEFKAIKFILKDKVEVISNWDREIVWSSGSIKHPAVLRLTYPIKRSHFYVSFSRGALIKRDESSCSYCGQKLTPSEITVDHVIPKAQGGRSSFTNCVVSCFICNGKKSNKTPEEAGMILLRDPVHPSFASQFFTRDKKFWHEDWDFYLGS